jgi:hypothetical protein
VSGLVLSLFVHPCNLLTGVTRPISTSRGRLHHSRIPKGGRLAIDVLQALPYDRRLSEKHTIGDKRIERQGLLAGRLTFVEDGQMGAAEQCDEFVGLQRRVEREEAVVGQLGRIRVEPLTDKER